MGRLLVRATKVVDIEHGCAIAVEFKISAALGRFRFYDASNGDIWFGFNSAALPVVGG